MATTTGTPYLRALSMWRARLQQPAVSSSTFSVVYAWGRGVPAHRCNRREGRKVRGNLGVAGPTGARLLGGVTRGAGGAREERY